MFRTGPGGSPRRRISIMSMSAKGSANVRGTVQPEGGTAGLVRRGVKPLTPRHDTRETYHETSG